MAIDEKTAFRGMLKARPDPGALSILPIGEQDRTGYFVNGFAANDATSTLNIWRRVEELYYPTSDPLIIMNCRADRVDRTEQFAKDVLPYINIDVLVLTGEVTKPIVEAYSQGKIQTNKIYNLESYSTEEIITIIKPYVPNRVIFGVGNIHGAAEPLIHQIEDWKIDPNEKEWKSSESDNHINVLVNV